MSQALIEDFDDLISHFTLADRTIILLANQIDIRCGLSIYALLKYCENRKESGSFNR